jgi:hypothetical protein
VMEGLSPCLVPLVRLTILQLRFVHPQGTNSLDRVSAQFCSMRASCASIFSTVFIFSSVSADVAGFVYVGVVVVDQRLLVWSLARFGWLRDVLRICKDFLRLSARCRPFLEREKSAEKSKQLGTSTVEDWRSSDAGIRGALVFCCSVTRMGSDAGYWEESGR